MRGSTVGAILRCISALGVRRLHDGQQLLSRAVQGGAVAECEPGADSETDAHAPMFVQRMSISASLSVRRRRGTRVEPTTSPPSSWHCYANTGARRRQKDGYLFHGRPLDPNELSQQFARFVRRTNLPRFRFHDVRHGFASLAFAGGVRLVVVSKSLGHASTGITANVYTHLLRDQKREKAAVLDAYFSAVFSANRVPSGWLVDCESSHAGQMPVKSSENTEVAGKCRNRTYQPACVGLSGFEDRAGHQTRTLPCLYFDISRSTYISRGAFWPCRAVVLRLMENRSGSARAAVFAPLDHFSGRCKREGAKAAPAVFTFFCDSRPHQRLILGFAAIANAASARQVR